MNLPGSTVAEVLNAASDRFGAGFVEQLESCRIWRNGEPCCSDDPVFEQDELAVLPPISGGSS